jgi:SAM-dependent methyltransferase
MSDLNPHGKQMADESMVRNLQAQITAIWPQEMQFIQRYDLRPKCRVLDAGCGTGEAAWRVAELLAESDIVGIDIVDEHLERARARCAYLGRRVQFEHQSVFELPYSDATFDLVLCRHLLQAVPHVGRVVGQLVRVTRPGGYLHFVAEDYGMLHFETRGALDLREFWHVVPDRFGAATGVDEYVGRNLFRILTDLSLDEIRVDYVAVDPIRVPRETFASIITAWRDGYSQAVGETTPLFARVGDRALQSND